MIEKGKNKYDKNIKNVGWDDDLMWSNIEHLLDKGESKTKYMLWLLPIAIILISIGIWSNYHSTTHNKPNLTAITGSNHALKPTQKTNKSFFPSSKHDNQKTLKNSYTNVAIASTHRLSNNNSQLTNKIIPLLKKSSGINIQQTTKPKAPSNQPLYNPAQVNIHSDEIQTDNTINKLRNQGPISIQSIETIRSLSIKSNRKKSIKKIEPVRSNTIDKPTSHPSIPWSIMLITSIGKVNKDIAYDHKSVWQNRLYHNENPISNTNYSMAITKSILQHINISTGLNYQKIITNFVGRDSTISIKTITSDSAFVTQSVHPIYYAGIRKKTKTTYRNLNVYNRYKHWSIPIEIGYAWHNNKNQFSLNTGILIRFNSKFKGYYISNKNTIVAFDNDNKSIIKHLGISQLKLSAYYARTIVKNTDIIMGFQSIIPLQSDFTILNHNNRNYNNKWTSYNIMLGIKYKITPQNK